MVPGSRPRRAAISARESPAAAAALAAGGIVPIFPPATPKRSHAAATAVEAAITRSALRRASPVIVPRGSTARWLIKQTAGISTFTAAAGGICERPQASTASEEPRRRPRASWTTLTTVAASAVGRVESRCTVTPAWASRGARAPPAVVTARCTSQPAARKPSATSSICRPVPTGSSPRAIIRIDRRLSARGGIAAYSDIVLIVARVSWQKKPYPTTKSPRMLTWAD